MQRYNYSHLDVDSLNNSLGDFIGKQAPVIVPRIIVGDHALSIFLLINSVIIIFIVGSLGCIFNLVNIVVFFKQGLKDPITITLFFLSVSDFGSVFTLWLQSMFLVLHFFPESFREVDPRYMLAFLTWPHAIFVRISCLLTVFIAMERWLCVTFPLHVGRIITPRTAKIYNVVVLSCLVALFVSLYLHSVVSRMFLPERNRTIFFITLSRSGVQFAVKMSTVVSSVYLSTFGLLVIFTILTSIKLNQQTKWRQGMSKPGQMSVATARNNKVVKMVVAICLIYIFLTIPSVVNTFLYIFVLGFVASRSYFNLNTLISQFCNFLEVANSTANFFIYFYMSSNYSNTLYELLGRVKKEARSEKSNA